MADIDDIVMDVSTAMEQMDDLSFEDQIEAINEIRRVIHRYSPFKADPVDCVQWVKNESVVANSWNPNHVAKPEKQLLELSIKSDGYTQPIVGYKVGDKVEVVDGFHRHLVGKECQEIRERVHGYLPVVSINSDREDQNDRMAATIRHNRARGKHSVDKMGDIVLELAKRNWSDAKISRELGLDPDECLRLKQITGIAEMFANEEFSEAWEVDLETPSDDD